MNKKLVDQAFLLGLAAMLSLLVACSVSLTKQPRTSEPAEPPAAITHTKTHNSDPQKPSTHESRAQASASRESESQTINAQASNTQAEEAENSPPASLVEDLKTVLAAELGVTSSQVLVKEATAVEWSDACLGAAEPDEMCAQVITPGYRIVLSTLTDEFEFHTDRTGKHFRRVRQAASEAEEIPKAETRQESESGE